MSVAAHTASRPANRLLAALPERSRAALLPRLERVELALRQELVRPDRAMHAVWFPETCMISMLVTLRDGAGAEVGLVGPEGMVGLPLLLGDGRHDMEGIVQKAGLAWALPAPALREAVETDPALRRLLLRYALAFHTQVARTAVCNGNHRTQQRLVRWLLMAHDRIGDDAFPMTHEFLAMMLGVRRAGITVAAGALQRAGLLRYERGMITIADRLGLEAAACECYRAVRGSYDRLVGGNGGLG